MGPKVVVALCFILKIRPDFHGNWSPIIASIQEEKVQGASYRHLSWKEWPDIITMNRLCSMVSR